MAVWRVAAGGNITKASDWPYYSGILVIFYIRTIFRFLYTSILESIVKIIILSILLLSINAIALKMDFLGNCIWLVWPHSHTLLQVCLEFFITLKN
jgi:hypothetical protein